MRHLGIFNNSGDVRTAIDQETLFNPYVAMVGGVLDYNSVVPTPPVQYMGTWSVNAGVYTFTIAETDPSYWADPVKIGEVAGYDADSDPADIKTWSIALKYDGEWGLEYGYPGLSETKTSYPYNSDTLDIWISSDTTSDAPRINTQLDSANVFSLESSNSAAVTLNMTTIDPVYPV